MSITQRNLSGYGLPVIEWERVRQTLATDHTQKSGTRRSRPPHVVADDDEYGRHLAREAGLHGEGRRRRRSFSSGLQTRKTR